MHIIDSVDYPIQRISCKSGMPIGKLPSMEEYMM